MLSVPKDLRALVRSSLLSAGPATISPFHAAAHPRGLTLFGQGPIFPLDLQLADIIDALVLTKARQKREKKNQ